MARRRREEEHENHERWLVSYADFITLLFAFFVVMYSISSINEGKYRVLSDSLVKAFDDPNRSLEPIKLGTPIHGPIVDEGTFAQPGAAGPQEAAGGRADAAMEQAARRVQANFKALVEKGLVKVSRGPGWMEVEIKSSVLFPTGSAELTLAARPVLAKIARILKDLPNPLRVEGHTDSRPIKTRRFPCNWELSASRAASVVRLFAAAGINPRRLSAVGFGPYRPVASNKDEAGRAKNRRVAIVVLAQEADRRRAALDPLQRQPSAPAPAAPQRPVRLGVAP